MPTSCGDVLCSVFLESASGNREFCKVMLIVMKIGTTRNKSSLIRNFVNYYFSNSHRSFVQHPFKISRGPELSHSQNFFFFYHFVNEISPWEVGKPCLLNSLVAFRYSLFSVFSRQLLAPLFTRRKEKFLDSWSPNFSCDVCAMENSHYSRQIL